MGMVVLAVVVSAFLASMQASFRSVRHQQQADIAISILDNVTEELLMLPLTDADLLPGTHTRTYSRAGIPATGGQAFYTIQWDISTLVTDSSIRNIALSARWNQGTTPHRIYWSTCRN